MVHEVVTRGQAAPYTHLTAACPWLEALVRSEDVAAANGVGDVRVLKTHLLPAQLPPHRTAVYLVRDPRDVAVSLYTHAVAFGALHGSVPLADFVERLCEGHAYFGNGGATWPAHVNAWTRHAAAAVGAKVLVLRYEDMVADLAGCVRAVAAHCEVILDAETVEQVLLPRLSLAYMRAHRDRFDYTWRAPVVPSFDFFARGAPGGWQQTDALIDWHRFSGIMADGLDLPARTLFPQLAPQPPH
jgi:hypothetical protein